MFKLAHKFNFYHGTSSVFLSSILKQGLDPAPKKRVWEEDYKRTPGEIGLESYPGVYLTNNFMVAYAASRTAMERFGGHRLIVVGTSETRSPEAKIDEDHVDEPGRGVAIQDKLVSDWWRSIRLLDYYTFDATDEELANVSKTYVEKALGIKPTAEVLKTAGSALRTWLDMRVALELERGDNSSYGITYKLRERFGENIPAKFKDPKGAIRIYRDAMDKFLGKAKELLSAKKDNFIHNIRLERPVAYKGANRILAVIELDNDNWDESGITKIIIRYVAPDGGGDAVRAMLDQYGRHIGGQYEVVG